MTLEERAMRFEGLDPAVINDALANATRLLGVVKGELDRVAGMAEAAKKIMGDVQHLLDTYEAQEPHIKKLIADVQSQIAAYQANQRRFGG